ncbi:MAG: hypothetical protein KDI27_10520 [Gammaproteobacteria bacterium]|nr:hypothetical protein [Gammaproteobacteria bacterium]MCB1851718.1 hypothetical protein [Gammaproteobacteria bacterium]MCP5417660.1 hypothetical protein [Chromatiaceae bacterium]
MFTAKLPLRTRKPWQWLLSIPLIFPPAPVGEAIALEAERHATPSLVSEVNRMGSVRVIVTLKISDAVHSNTQAIAQVQRLLLEQLSPFSIRIINQFRSFPLLALEVGPVALGYLLASPLVSSVEADAIAHPQLPGADGTLDSMQ